MSDDALPGVPGGDPAALLGRAEILAQAAGVLDDVTAGFAADARSVPARAGWTGAAADQYARHVEWLAGELSRLGPAARRIAAALTEYAANLRPAQAEAVDATGAWHAAQLLPPGAQTAAMEDARQRVLAARARAHAAAVQAADELAGARSELPRFEVMAPSGGHAAAGAGPLGIVGVIAAIRDRLDDGAATGANFFRNFLKEISGYTTNGARWSTTTSAGARAWPGR